MQKFLLPAFILLNTIVFCQSPIGVWKTIDDRSGEEQSHIEIYKKNGMLYGKIIKMKDLDPNTICDQCKGEQKNKPLLGLDVIGELKPYKYYWNKGNAIDPADGKVYGCSIWLEDGNLKVRGKHWIGLYRTQTWYRIE